MYGLFFHMYHASYTALTTEFHGNVKSLSFVGVYIKVHMFCLKSCRNYVVTKHDLIYHLEDYFKC